MKYTDSDTGTKCRVRFEKVALTFGSRICLSILTWNTCKQYLLEPTSRYIHQMKKPPALVELQSIDLNFAFEQFTMWNTLTYCILKILKPAPSRCCFQDGPSIVNPTLLTALGHKSTMWASDLLNGQDKLTVGVSKPTSHFSCQIALCSPAPLFVVLPWQFSSDSSL